ncbi:XTP/dITP diphosphatase [Chloroflexota bacterium]
MRPKLLVATNNAGKIREYHHLLGGIPFDIITPQEAEIDLDVDETGTTFEENARLKAKAFAEASGLISLADDSGLEVDALGGEPGVYSKRYAGEHATDAERNAFLLNKMSGIPSEARTAYFRCIIAICQPGRETILCEGECVGEITSAPRGEHGFGYDPIFCVTETGRTMAELTPAEKNRVSHRARAAAKARWHLLIEKEH